MPQAILRSREGRCAARRRRASREREKSGRERKFLRVIDGLIVLLALVVYLGLSLVLAGLLKSSGVLPNYFLSALVSIVLISPLALVMLRSCFGREAFQRFERTLYFELVRRGLVEFAPELDEDSRSDFEKS